MATKMLDKSYNNEEDIALFSATVYYIPCNPYSDYGRFTTSLPCSLIGTVPEEKWRSVILGLNAFIIEHEKPSFWNIFEFLLPQHSDRSFRKLENAVNNYINKVNKELRIYGISLDSPTVTTFSELRVNVL